MEGVKDLSMIGEPEIAQLNGVFLEDKLLSLLVFSTKKTVSLNSIIRTIY